MEHTGGEVSHRLRDRLRPLLDDPTLTSIEGDGYPHALVTFRDSEPVPSGYELSTRNAASMEREKKL